MILAGGNRLLFPPIRAKKSILGLTAVDREVSGSILRHYAILLDWEVYKYIEPVE